MRLIQIRDADDPALAAVAQLLLDVFSDPNTILGLDRLREFLSESSAQRRFNVLTIRDGSDALAGATIFSYVPRSNCGFSEYMLARTGVRGLGVGRMLFEARRAELDRLARGAGQDGCNGVFIEVDNPERTPAAMLERERMSAMDANERLRLFAHFGFLRVDMAYVQPPLREDKRPVDYLDLLFAPWRGDPHRVSSAWITDTLTPIWRAWSPGMAAPQLTSPTVRLRPLFV